MEKLSSVSFFCPAYNDEKNLPKVIPKAVKFISKIAKKYEIIIVEDCSPDKTAEVADNLARKYPNVRVIHHKKNMGYGGELKDGFNSSKYDYVMTTDGDNQYDVYEFARGIPLLKKYDVAAGYVPLSRKAGNFRRKVQSFLYNFLVIILFFIHSKDINCSMKIYKKKVLNSFKIHSDSAFIDAEMIVKSQRNGFKIGRFPVTHYPRISGPEGGVKFKVIWGTIKEMILFRLGLL